MKLMRNEKIIYKIIYIKLFFYAFLDSQYVTYDWPIYPLPPGGKMITSTFGEYRPPSNPHFHENDFSNYLFDKITFLGILLKKLNK